MNDYQEDYYYSDNIAISEQENRELEQWLIRYFKGEDQEGVIYNRPFCKTCNDIVGNHDCDNCAYCGTDR